MTPLHRWKLLSLALASCMAYSWWHGEASSDTAPAAAHARYTGRLRISAAALGISTDELIRELFAAKSYIQMRPLAQRLGIVGDDAAIDAVRPLVNDRRAGVPGLVIEAFGAIATEHAVDVLIELAGDPRDEVRGAAASALGTTHNVRGEPILIELAERADETRGAALDALAELASARAIEVLARVASHPGDAAGHAVRALARVDQPAARAALVGLVDAPSVSVAATAIGALTADDLAPELVAKLTGFVRGSEHDLVLASLGALAKAGDAGVAILREATSRGPIDLRAAAMSALAEADEAEAIATLRTILESEPGRAADAAANVLADLDSDDARDALISAALTEETGGRIVEYLLRQRGPDVEQALLVIAKSDSRERWDAIEHLVRGGNPDALEVAVGQATGGEAAAWLAAMQVLVDAGTPDAIDALVAAVEVGGEVKPRALAIAGAARPDDPRIGALLAEAARSSDPHEAAAAASALAAIGTGEARDALVAALGSRDVDVVAAAAESLAKFRISDDIGAALRGAVGAHPDLESQVMSQLVAAGSSVGLELARQAITGGSPDLAYRAVVSLQVAGTPAALDLLVEGARSPETYVRAQALSSLGTAGDPRATEVAAQALRDTDPTVRSSAARTLGEVGTPKARDLLVQLTRSTDDDDRQAAVTSLRRFDDAGATRRLADLMRDPSPAVAYTAIDALVEREDALPVLRGFLADASASAYLRRQAARLLSNRGVIDPQIDVVLETDE